MTNAKPKVTHVIFDCDGLLLDTEDIYFEVGKIIVAQYEKTFEWSLKSRLMGMPWNEAIDILLESLDLPITREEYICQAGKLQYLFEEAKLLPGVDKLISHLTKHSIPIAVASSSLTKTFRTKTKNHTEFFKAFSAVILGDNPAVKMGKPHPDIFLEAANSLLVVKENAFTKNDDPDPSVDYSQFLAFEDSPVGVMAARRAGMPVVWIPDPRQDLTLFQHDPNVFLIASMEYFDPVEWGSTAIRMTKVVIQLS